jgi:MoaA/NifB/PqqE/SkfB family radical SAM enzyme
MMNQMTVIRMPLVVVWRVTEACNLSCDFCAYAQNLPRARMSVDPAEVLRVGKLLSEEKGRKVLLSWLGGEPLAWKPIADLSRALHGFGLRLGCTTNGVPLQVRSLRTLVAEVFDEITFSIDGRGDWNDRVRAMPGLFEKLRDSILGVREAAHEARRERPLLIKVNTILMQQSIAAFEDLCEVLVSWGVEEVTFNQLGGNDRPEFYPAHRLLPAQVEHFIETFPAMTKRLQARGLRIHGGPRYLERFRATSRGERIAIDDCGPGQWFLFIDERCRVAPCSATPAEYGLPLSEIRTSEDLAALPARFAALRAAHRAEACGDCHSTQVFGKFV